MGGAALLRVLVMVGGVYVSGDGLCLSVAYECGMWSGMFSVFMYLCHVECMVVECGVVSFGSFLCSVSADWRRVALRVFIAV